MIGVAVKKVDKDVPLVCPANGTSSKGDLSPPARYNIQLLEQEEDKKESDLTKTIEHLRKQLVKMVGEQGFSSKEVVELSQCLDKFIVKAQINMKTKWVGEIKHATAHRILRHREH